MDRHPVVLQQRIEVLPLGGNRGEHIEGTRDEVQHQQEEDRDAGQNRQRVRARFRGCVGDSERR